MAADSNRVERRSITTGIGREVATTVIRMLTASVGSFRGAPAIQIRSGNTRTMRTAATFPDHGIRLSHATYASRVATSWWGG